MLWKLCEICFFCALGVGEPLEASSWVDEVSSSSSPSCSSSSYVGSGEFPKTGAASSVGASSMTMRVFDSSVRVVASDPSVLVSTQYSLMWRSYLSLLEESTGTGLWTPARQLQDILATHMHAGSPDVGALARLLRAVPLHGLDAFPELMEPATLLHAYTDIGACLRKMQDKHLGKLELCSHRGF